MRRALAQQRSEKIEALTEWNLRGAAQSMKH